MSFAARSLPPEPELELPLSAPMLPPVSASAAPVADEVRGDRIARLEAERTRLRAKLVPGIHRRRDAEILREIGRLTHQILALATGGIR
jgi:hypothetical protein